MFLSKLLKFLFGKSPAPRPGQVPPRDLNTRMRLPTPYVTPILGDLTPKGPPMPRVQTTPAPKPPSAPWPWPAGRPQPPQPPQPPKPAVRHTLDSLKHAEAFQPLSDSEVKRRAGKLGPGWGNPWFGRRDVIPPISDPRTLLIDQGMVGHGFIKPEELVEIHRIGDQMAALRPQLVDAHRQVDAAVEQDREARKQLREQKKAEAAERKRLRAEQIAERKATDIVFLGRGVSRGLADRRSNIEMLQAGGLPVLSTPADVAAALRLPIPRLRWLAHHTESSEISHYIRFLIPKKSGGHRELAAPHGDMRYCQRWIFENILQPVPLRDAAHGFALGRSTMSNAVPHVGKEVLINADLKDFFPSITYPRVKGIFQNLGYSPAVATVLALLCTECPRRQVTLAGRKLHVATGPRALPQGACSSPAISNLAARMLDTRLQGMADKLQWTYTRYADDITLSTSGEPAQKTAWILAKLRHIAQSEGFTVNEEKTRVQRPSSRQSVTGIVVNQRPNAPRELRRRLRAILHQAQTTGLEAQNKDQHPHFQAWVQGMISYIQMIHPEEGAKLRRAFEKLAA